MTTRRLIFPKILCLALCAAWLTGGAGALTQAPETPSGLVARVFGNDIRLGDIGPGVDLQCNAWVARSLSPAAQG